MFSSFNDEFSLYRLIKLLIHSLNPFHYDISLWKSIASISINVEEFIKTSLPLSCELSFIDYILLSSFSRVWPCWGTAFKEF